LEDGVKKNAFLPALWGIVVLALSYTAPQREAYGLEESTGPGGSNATAVHQLGQTGQDVNIGLILSGNVRITHQAFKDGNGISHAFNYDFGGDGISIIAHDTQLAGIISSRGDSSHPNDFGVAPGADIHCARVSDNSSGVSWTELDNALETLITTQNCRVIVTGFELVGVDPDGNSSMTMLYDYYAYQYDVIFANAAGNENTFVAIFGDAYNGITTGGLRLTDPSNPFDYRRAGSITGSGPTADGRRKPDITAPAQSQTTPTSSGDFAWATVGSAGGETSYSVPQAAGAAAVLLGQADITEGPNDNSSVVIKAVMVNAAFPNVKNKSAVETNPADSNNTWHKDRGYGRLDVLRGYQTLDTSEVEPDISISQEKGWGFGRLEQGQSDNYTITVTAKCRLIATLAWQRRVTKTGFILNAYLADLDMIVYKPNDVNAIFSESLFNLDPNNNLEKCDLLIAEQGDYTIEIVNNSTNGEPADYGMAFELRPIITGDLPPVDYTVDFLDFSALANDWLSEDSTLDALLEADGIINYGDLSILTSDWLKTDYAYFQGL